MTFWCDPCHRFFFLSSSFVVVRTRCVSVSLSLSPLSSHTSIPTYTHPYNSYLYLSLPHQVSVGRGRSRSPPWCSAFLSSCSLLPPRFPLFSPLSLFGGISLVSSVARGGLCPSPTPSSRSHTTDLARRTSGLQSLAATPFLFFFFVCPRRHPRVQRTPLCTAGLIAVVGLFHFSISPRL